MSILDPKQRAAARQVAESARAEQRSASVKWPRVGTLERQHTSAKRLADLQDEETAALVLCQEQLRLDEALERTWTDDRHLLTYRVDADPKGEEYAFARVSKRSPFVAQLEQAGGRVRVAVLLFDFDLPKVKGEDGTMVKQRWRPEALDTFVHEALAHAVTSGAIPEPTFFYDTAHGARFGFVLTEEVSHLDAEAMCSGLIEQFAEAGIELDSACSDFTRLFRLPRTTREDSGEPYEPTYLLLDGPALDPRTVRRVEGSASERFAEIDPYQGEQPDPDECREMLVKRGGNGRVYDSDLVKVARTMLQGREAGEVIFGDPPRDLAVGDENWNSQVTKLVGQTVGMLARQDDVTPEGIYALLFAAVEQLQSREIRGANATDWYEKTWDLVSRMWSNEEAQIIAQRQEQERRLAEAREHRSTLIEQLREARPGDVPDAEEEAQEWLQRRMIASDGRQHHYVMRPDGTYSYKSVTDSMLIPMIRELGMEEHIPTTEPRGKTTAMRSPAHILNDHATPIAEIVCSASVEHAYIDGDAGEKTLYTPIHRLNPKVVARHDGHVDEWLRALGGERYDRLVEWLSHALDARRPICALNLHGAPGTGKGLLAAGLAECFRGEERNDGRALGKWNLGLLKSPVVNCDEGVPNIANDEAMPLDQAFRSLVSGGRMTIRAMRMDPFTAVLHPRILFTSNDKNVAVEALSGSRRLTAQDIEAIEVRLLSIEVSDAANRLLSRHGNYEWTSGWVGGAVPSKYVLAGHILHLFENRKPSKTGTGRLLVEGDVGSFKQDHFRTSRTHVQGVRDLVREVVRADGKQDHAVTSQQRPVVHIEGRRLFVAASLFEPNCAGRMDRFDRPEGVAIVEALERSGLLGPAKSTRKGGKAARWREVGVSLLREYAEAIEELDLADVAAIDRRLHRKES